MRPYNSIKGTRNIPIRLITLFASLLVLAILFSTASGASANQTSENGTDPFRQNDPSAQQVAPEQDASLNEFEVTVNGELVTLVPTFDPDTTHYTATVNSERVILFGSVTQPAAGIDQTSVGDETFSLDPPGNVVAKDANLTEGATTTASLRVLASDGVTTKTYHLFLSRPADPAVPDISMAANTAEYTSGLGGLYFTLTREGDAADSLDVAVNITQEHPWLTDTARTATFEAGDAEAILIFPASRFSSSVTQSGELTATVDPITGYDTSGAIVHIRVISQEGPAVSVTIEHPTYTVDEDIGTLDITLVARAHSSVTRIGEFDVTVLSQPVTATAMNDEDPGDYVALSELVRFAPSDFQEENGSLVGRKTVSITILDDDTYEGDEQFHVTLGRAPGLSSEVILLDPEGEPCVAECPNPYVVTIRDNDGSPVTVQFGQNSYTVVEGGNQAVTVTLSDDPERTVVIPIAATDQDGATGADYSGVPQSVTFNPGETTQTISFVATHDTIDEDGENVMLSFGSMLPTGVTQGPINETVVSLTERKLTDYTEKPGISVPMCKPNGIFIYWYIALKFEDDPPPYGWRVERRHLSNEGWITTRFDFLGAESDALQTFNHEYWDWIDTSRRSEVDYTYRVRSLDNNGELMDERMWSRRAPVLCP